MRKLAILLALFTICSLTKAQTAHNPNDPNFAQKCASGQQLKYTITSNKEPYTVIVNGMNGDLEKVKKLQIPETVNYRNIDFTITAINVDAFSEMPALTSVSIPKTVTAIGAKAFFGCKSLKSIKIGGTIEHCGENAFAGTNITKPLYSGKNLVYYPAGQTEYTINEGTEKLLEYSFGTCADMTSITIPASVSKIYATTFANCDNLGNITIAEGNKTYDSRSNCNAIIRTEDNTLVKGFKTSTIPDGITTIGRIAFAEIPISSIEIPQSIITIEDSAFFNCELNKVTIPQNIRNIGDCAFCKNKSLAVVNFDAINCEAPKNMKSAFSQCMSLASVNFGEAVKEVPAWMFTGCTELRYVTLSSSIEKIGQEAFAECSSLTYIEIPNSVNQIEAKAFFRTGIYEPVFNENIFIYYAGDDTEYKIPEGIKTIAGYAFYENTNLKSLTIPNSVTTIDAYAFCAFRSIEKITIPNSVTYIGDNAFRYSGITSISIPNSITKIEKETFSGCTKIKSITLPKSIVAIDSNVFYWCDLLESITIQNPDIQINKNTLNGCSTLKRINVPKGSKNRIVNAVGKEFSNIIIEK